MFTDWDERFDLLVGADIRDSDTEPWMDSGVHDLLYGSKGQDPEALSFPRPRIDDEGRHVIEWIRDRRFP
jgi:hypothetical protein